MVQPAVRNLRQESVSEHVRRHIDSTDVSSHAESIGDHAENLADRIQQTDERLEARLHQKFDHRLGKLDTKLETEVEKAASVSVDAISQISSDLIKLLTSPTTVRQAILINEILSRPDFDDE